MKAGLLLSLALLTLAVRCLEFPSVFSSDGEVYLKLYDSSYHARRAYFSFVNFPSVLVFDSYLAYPDGARVPMPPLFDWSLGGVARLFGASHRSFERVAAWVSPALAAVTSLAVFATGHRVAGAGVGLGAAAIFAMLPMHAARSGIGDADHHAAVSLLVGCWLALAVHVTRPGLARGRLWLATASLALVRAAMLLSWSGSLLYLLIGDGALLLAGGGVEGRRDMMRAQAGGVLASAVLIVPWLITSGGADFAPLATTTLSWLHVLVLGAVTLLWVALGLLESRWPAHGMVAHGERVLLLAVALLLAFSAIPALREAFATASGFVGKGDAWAATNMEQRSLFAFLPGGRPSQAARASDLYGGFAYLIPFGVIACALRVREPSARAPALVLTCWSAALGTLAILQVRFGSEFAVPGAVSFALLLDEGRRFLVDHRRWPAARSGALVSVAALALLCPAVAAVYLPQARALLHALGSRPEDSGEEPAAALAPRQSFSRFAATIRAVTPGTSGFLDPESPPEYSILCLPVLGHSVRYEARRPTPAGGFGPYADAAKLRAVKSFFRTPSEQKAVAIAEELGARYVLTAANFRLRPGSVEWLLHGRDGSATETRAHLEHFRLITEGPAGGTPLGVMFPSGVPGRPIPYKLFEVVEGAVLEGVGAPGAEIIAEVTVRTPLGRRFDFRARGRVDDDGFGRLRVPYATRTRQPSQPDGPYRVHVGNAAFLASVSDRNVQRGEVVRLEPLSYGARGGPINGVRTGLAIP